MKIYVDEPQKRIDRFNGWCHMFSHDVEALHGMAQKIGLKRSWFQDKPRFPHYDVAPANAEEQNKKSPGT